MFEEIQTTYDFLGVLLIAIGIASLLGRIPLPGTAVIKTLTFMIKAPVAVVLILIGVAMILYL